MKFIKKPVVIEAVQFDDIPAHDPSGVWRRPEDNSPYVVTIHDQRVYLTHGDWIVPEPDGVHYYPIKPDIFAAMYESESLARQTRLAREEEVRRPWREALEWAMGFIDRCEEVANHGEEYCYLTEDDKMSEKVARALLQTGEGGEDANR